MGQQGEHSSAFVKGTHMCGHNIINVVNMSFDANNVEFTQHNQAIPLPHGMPAIEQFPIRTLACKQWAVVAAVHQLEATAFSVV